MTKAKWQLTQTAFDQLLAQLDADRDEAGRKYLLLRRNLVRFFAGRGLAAADEHADETLNRLARKLAAGATFENIGQYAVGIARLLVLEVNKGPALSPDVPDLAVPPRDEEREERERDLHCLERCLRELPEEGRALIVAYYEGEKRDKIEQRQQLAARLNLPPSALRSRAVRLRDKLEECIQRCRRLT